MTSSRPIEDYALIGDCHSAALVSRDGSIDWLCLPRFDSGACFAALLGTPDHGRFRICPQGDFRVRRRYAPDTMILETEFTTDTGRCLLRDCMVVGGERPALVRIVEGIEGEVALEIELVIRFDYGSIVPWVRRRPDGIVAIAGPDALHLRTALPLSNRDLRTTSEFTLRAGDRVSLELMWTPAHEPEQPVPVPDPVAAVRATESFWRDWAGRCRFTDGPASTPEVREAVVRSLLTLKALTYAPTGAIVAAPTTSLPERLGGVRNWDYRYCWLRDATYSLYALLLAGYYHEACAWRSWLVRALAGTPSQINIMYGIGGERRLTEQTLDWLPGYAGSRPVRIGNAAYNQLQLDVFGEVLDTLQLAQRSGLPHDEDAWRVQKIMLRYLEDAWQEPDEGIWEIRGPRQHFTHSKVMAWVAFDRAIEAVERCGLQGPVDSWRKTRDRIHAEVCSRGYSERRGCFVQRYEAEDLDASLLMLGLVGFLRPDDPRLARTVAAIEADLLHDGLLMRYRTESDVDGLPANEGVFMACSFWLADSYLLIGRRADAERLFTRLLAMRNDVGLLSEEYEPRAGRFVGNFPQAFSHIALVNTAYNLTQAGGAADDRSKSAPLRHSARPDAPPLDHHADRKSAEDPHAPPWIPPSGGSLPSEVDDGETA